MNPPPPPDCLHPTCTVVIIEILLRTRAAMHTTIGLALEMNPADFMNWPPGNIGHSDSLWCQRATQNRFLLWLVTMLQNDKKNCVLLGPPFVGAPVRPNMLNMPKSASVAGCTLLWDYEKSELNARPDAYPVHFLGQLSALPVAALHQGKWPGWKIHRSDSSPGSALPSLRIALLR